MVDRPVGPIRNVSSWYDSISLGHSPARLWPRLLYYMEVGTCHASALTEFGHAGNDIHGTPSVLQAVQSDWLAAPLALSPSSFAGPSHLVLLISDDLDC